MSANSEADQIAALVRELSKIKKRSAALDPADAAAVREARQLKSQFASTLRHCRGRLETELDRGYTTAADRSIGEELARLSYLGGKKELERGYEGRCRILTSRSKHRTRTPSLPWLIVRLAISIVALAYSVYNWRQLAEWMLGTPPTS